MKDETRLSAFEKRRVLLKTRIPKDSLEKRRSHSWKLASEALRVSTHQAVLPYLTASTLGHPGISESPIALYHVLPVMGFKTIKSIRKEMF